MRRIYFIAILVLGTIIVSGSIGNWSHTGLLVVAAPVSKGMMLVITQVLVMDGFIHTIRPRTMGVVLMVGLTTKASCQVAYQGKAKITFHAKG